MKTLQILGTGCARCDALAEAVKKAAAELGIEHQLQKVTDLRQIMSFGVMTTPALVVDGSVRATGKVPSHAELKTLLSATN